MFRRTKQTDDAVDDRIWRRVIRVLEACHRGDVKAHADEFRSWPDELSIQEQRRMQLYLRFLLGRAIQRRLNGDCSPDRLRSLAESIKPAAARLVRADTDTLTEVFRDALGISHPEDTLRGVTIDIIGSAALGPMLANPRADLAEMRPHLVSYCKKHRDELAQVEESG